jgi:hypothetical protein
MRYHCMYSRVDVRPTRMSSFHTGLGKLEHYPGDAFVHELTAKCLEHGLQAFASIGLSGLIGVSTTTAWRLWAAGELSCLLAEYAWRLCRGTLASDISQTRPFCGASSRP